MECTKGFAGYKTRRKLHKLALRYGFVESRGRYVKEWPSGKQWSFEYDGSNPLIQDEHGRIIKDESDGITTFGLLTEAAKTAKP